MENAQVKRNTENRLNTTEHNLGKPEHSFVLSTPSSRLARSKRTLNEVSVLASPTSHASKAIGIHLDPQPLQGTSLVPEEWPAIHLD